jgi:hypothetical protein
MCFSEVTILKDLIKQEKYSMKTKMKKLISISTIPVLALTLLLVLGTVLADDSEKPAPSLTGTTDYDFVGHLQQIPDDLDEEGRLLVWEGTISGDIEGVIQWWMEPMSITGQASHYVDRWEIWSDDPLENSEAVLLLAGDEEGTTTVRHGKNSVWRANGLVTDVSAGLEDWIGCEVHDDGHFTWAAPGLPDHGTGTFRVN